jgi:hypothetical protein
MCRYGRGSSAMSCIECEVISDVTKVGPPHCEPTFNHQLVPNPELGVAGVRSALAMVARIVSLRAGKTVLHVLPKRLNTTRRWVSVILS